MKKVIFLFLFSFAIKSFSQNAGRYYNSWRLGLNIGGMWQTADVRSTAGVAGGFTLEKGIFENKTNVFSLAIRGRGLFGNTYGLDFNKNYDVINNPALNGSYNPEVNYNDTANANSFIYNNYKTQINEGTLELQISFNRLREKKNILLNLWGGIGFTGYRANINLLNADGKMYNYNKVDSSGTSKSALLSAHKNLLDKSYESYANGSKKNNIYTFSPSAGIGLGYKFGDGFSIIYEYKITFPQGVYADYLDGITGSNKDMIAGSKDYYHYTGLNLLFTIGRGKKTKDSTHHTSNTYHPVTTNTVIAPPPTNTIAVNPINTNIPAQPTVSFINPSSSPYTEKRDNNFNVSAKVYNVSSRSQIAVSVNGMPFGNFSYSGNTITFPVSLVAGNNTIIITASNNTGSVSKTAVINYSGIPPQISFTSPLQNPYISTISVVDVSATIKNVNNNYDVVIKYNGSVLNNYSFSILNGLFTAQLPLNPGTNQLEINAINSWGNDNKKLTVNYVQLINTTTVVANASRPVKVTITNPGIAGYKTNNSMHNVVASVTGVTSASQVTVTVNGVIAAFNYLNGIVNFDAFLSEGMNTVNVSAKNASASDSKSATIQYEVIRKTPPPSVTITNPQPSPFTTGKNDFTFKANTFFVNDISEIEVKFNNTVVNNFVYDKNTGSVEYLASLIPDVNNVLDIKVSNVYGSNFANAVVIQKSMTGVEIGIGTKVICHKKDQLTSETLTIYENEWPQHQAHGDYEGKCKEVINNTEIGIDNEISICHIDSQGLSKQILIKQSEWNYHKLHGDKIGPCPKFGNNGGVGEVDPEIIICHEEERGKQTITISQSQWPAHQAHGDQMGACPKVIKPVEEQKITICHVPPGNSGNPQTIDIPQSAWPAHQSHGDYLGNCNATGNLGNQGNPAGEKKITICHIPPGNNSNPQTIEINESAWPAHQAHGDTKTPCSQKLNQPKEGEVKETEVKEGGNNNQGGRPMQKDTIQNKNIKFGKPR